MEGTNLPLEIDKKLDRSFRENTEDFLEKIDEKLQHLKSEFFERIDPILKEATTAREERPLIENRIEALEEIQPKGKHLPAS